MLKKSLKRIGGLDNYAGLPRSIYILFIARIINRFGGFVHAFLVMYLEIYLGRSEEEIGSFLLLSGLAGFVGSYIGGKFGDSYSRKRIYLSAQSIAAVLFLPCAYSAYIGRYDVVPWFIIASSFFSSAVRPVSTAMVTDLVDKEDRKRAFSLLYLGINVGVAIGPVVAAYLLHDHLVWFFLVDAITTFIAVVMVGLWVEERRITEEEMEAIDAADSEAKEEGGLFKAFIKRPMLVVFVLFAVINSMMYAQVGFAFPLQLAKVYGEQQGPALYAKLTMFNAGIVLLFTASIHYLTRHVKPIYNIASASLLYAVGMGMMGVINHTGMFYVSTLIWTIGEIQAVTNQSVYLMSHTPVNYRSSFMGVISIITSLGYVASPKLAGILLTFTGSDYKQLWSVVFIGGIIATLAFVIIGRMEKTKKNPTQVLQE